MYVSYGLTFSSLRGGAEPPSREGSWPTKRSFPQPIPLVGWLLAASKFFPKLAQENLLAGYGFSDHDYCLASAREHYTVEPSFTDTRLINGQFRLSQWKAHIISLKLTLLKRTPLVRTTDTFLCPELQTLI